MKTNDELISIIVPIYNVERHLSKCIESICAQTYSLIEIILIDDGSTDNSGVICEEYATLDSRIKVIHKKNGGVASARNTGLRFATGNYIGFIDPDDWIESNMYENMYNKIKKDDSDICICNYIIDTIKHSLKIRLPFELDILNKQDIIDYIIPPLLSSKDLDDKIEMHGGVWRILVKNKLIKMHHLKFQYDLLEDKIFNIQFYLKCNRVSVDNNFYYHYCIHPNTLSTKYREHRFEILKKVNCTIENIIKEEKMYEVFESRLKIQYIKFATLSVVNEIHPFNKKNHKVKIDTIKSICRDKKLQEIINDSIIKVH